MARSASATRPGQPNGEGHDGIVATGTEASACATPKTKDKIKAPTRYCETQNGKKESGFEEGKSSEEEVRTTADRLYPYSVCSARPPSLPSGHCSTRLMFVIGGKADIRIGRVEVRL
jgi:hypothetical protein